jgi:hypothetical protein
MFRYFTLSIFKIWPLLPLLWRKTSQIATSQWICLKDIIKNLSTAAPQCQLFEIILFVFFNEASRGFRYIEFTFHTFAS